MHSLRIPRRDSTAVALLFFYCYYFLALKQSEGHRDPPAHGRRGASNQIVHAMHRQRSSSARADARTRQHGGQSSTHMRKSSGRADSSKKDARSEKEKSRKPPHVLTVVSMKTPHFMLFFRFDTPLTLPSQNGKESHRRRKSAKCVRADTERRVFLQRSSLT